MSEAFKYKEGQRVKITNLEKFFHPDPTFENGLKGVIKIRKMGDCSASAGRHIYNVIFPKKRGDKSNWFFTEELKPAGFCIENAD